MSDFESRHKARLDDLRAKLEVISFAIAALPGRRRQHALHAVEGDREATQAIADIDAEEQDLLKQQALTNAAIEECERLSHQHAAKEGDIIAARRQARARELGAAVITLNAEADAVMKNLCEVLQRRRHQLDLLHRETGALDSRMTFRLSGKECLTAAAHYAGLNQHFELTQCSPQNRRALCDSNRILPSPAKG
jgi:hypothetical protein